MNTSCNEVREQLRNAIDEYGVTVGDTGAITDMGSFECQPAEVLYWHNAYMLGNTGEHSGIEWSAYLVDEFERDVFGLDPFAEAYAVLYFDDQGFVKLSYASSEEVLQYVREDEEMHEEEYV